MLWEGRFLLAPGWQKLAAQSLPSLLTRKKRGIQAALLPGRLPYTWREVAGELIYPYSSLTLSSVVRMAGWRNGRRPGFKILCPVKGRTGSSPVPATSLCICCTFFWAKLFWLAIFFAAPVVRLYVPAWGLDSKRPWEVELHLMRPVYLTWHVVLLGVKCQAGHGPMAF